MVVGGLTLISRVTGFIRDMVIAYIFGAGSSTDAFLVAFKIPNFLRRLFAEGAFSQAFIPILSEYRMQRGEGAVKILVAQVAGSLGGILILIALIGIIGASWWVLLFAPGFFHHPEKYQLTVEMLQITFPYLFFIALTAFAGGILNTYGHFAVPALTPVLLNLTMIGAAWGLSPYFEHPILALAWGVSLAGIIQLTFQLPFLHRLHLVSKPRFNWYDEGVTKVRQLMIPAIFGVSVSQINLLIDTLLASFLATGSVSWLYYSDRLIEFPLGVFGLALSTVMLPTLSKSVAQGDMQTYAHTLDWALRWVCLILIPSTLGLMVLAGPILATLFHSGQFTDHDVFMTTRSLIAYTLGLTGFVLVKVLASGFYSRQDTKTPVKIGIIAMVSNIVLNFIFIFPLQHAGLALSISLSALLNAGLLYYHLHKENVFRPLPGWRTLLLQIFTASITMAFIVWEGSGTLSEWLVMARWNRVFFLLEWIGIGILIYGIVLMGLGFRLRHVSLNTL